MNGLLNSNTVFGALSSLVGGIFLFLSFRQAEVAFVLPGDIPPFLVPKVFLVLWIALSLAILVSGLRLPPSPLGEQNHARIVMIAVLLVVVTWLMRSLGFMIVAPVAAFATCAILGYRRHLLNAAVAVLASGALYLLLTRVAELSLPKIPVFW